MRYAVAAINTLNATGWLLLKAKVFGKKTIQIEGNLHVIIYHYKGKPYLTSWYEGA